MDNCFSLSPLVCEVALKCYVHLFFVGSAVFCVHEQMCTFRFISPNDSSINSELYCFHLKAVFRIPCMLIHFSYSLTFSSHNPIQLNKVCLELIKIWSTNVLLVFTELWWKDTWTNNDTVLMTSELYSSTSEKVKQAWQPRTNWMCKSSKNVANTVKNNLEYGTAGPRTLWHNMLRLKEPGRADLDFPQWASALEMDPGDQEKTQQLGLT